MPRILDCNKNELELGNHVAFVSGGEIKVGKIIELTQKFGYAWKNGVAIQAGIQTFMKVQAFKGASRRDTVYRTRYPERAMKLADEAAIEGIKQLVPFGRKSSTA